ncbi:chromosome segregation protein SMC, partial [Nocardia sp. NPDC004722]
AAALGPLADPDAADTGPSAHAAVRALKEADGGRAALVFADGSTGNALGSTPGGFGQAQAAVGAGPLVSDIAGSGAGANTAAGQLDSRLPGSARWLAEVVDCPANLRGAIAALTTGIAVADDLATAAQVIAARPELRVVTREGDLTGSGWVLGGSDRAPSQLEVQADIDSAKDELVSWQRQAEELEAALAGALAEQTDRKEAVDHALLALHESDQALVAIYDRLGRLGHSARTAQRECDRLLAQRADTESGREDTLAKLAELEDRLRNAENEQADLDPEAAGTETAGYAREEAAAALAEARSMEVEARLAVRTAEERAESVRGKADSLRRAARAERENRA